jgi:two-component system response regulator (stage 0 sporulation protein F)
MNRILIVDDEKSIQLLFADELTEEGYEVITTGDGLDLLQDIRNTYYDLPVVMCTAYPDFKYDLKSIAADYYVVKSSDLRELKRKIKMAFESGEQFHSRTILNHLHQEAAPLQNTH